MVKISHTPFIIFLILFAVNKGQKNNIEGHWHVRKIGVCESLSGQKQCSLGSHFFFLIRPNKTNAMARNRSSGKCQEYSFRIWNSKCGSNAHRICQHFLLEDGPFSQVCCIDSYFVWILFRIYFMRWHTLCVEDVCCIITFVVA